MPACLHSSAALDEALARAQFLIDQRRRVGLACGESGVGKTLFLARLAEEATAAGSAVASINLVGVGATDVVWLLADRLGVWPREEAETHQVWRALADRLTEHRFQRLPTLLLFDDADEARLEVLEQAVRLAQLDPSPEAALTTILAVQPRRLGKLPVRLLELAELRIDLEPWDQSDTAAYVREALAKAGARSNLFSDEALAKLHAAARGVPRRVQQLGDLALVAGAGQRLRQIDADTVISACEELGVVVVERVASQR